MQLMRPDYTTTCAGDVKEMDSDSLDFRYKI